MDTRKESGLLAGWTTRTCGSAAHRRPHNATVKCMCMQVRMETATAPTEALQALSTIPGGPAHRDSLLPLTLPPLNFVHRGTGQTWRQSHTCVSSPAVGPQFEHPRRPPTHEQSPLLSRPGSTSSSSSMSLTHLPSLPACLPASLPAYSCSFCFYHGRNETSHLHPLFIPTHPHLPCLLQGPLEPQRHEQI